MSAKPKFWMKEYGALMCDQKIEGCQAIKWISVKQYLPDLSDRAVLVYFSETESIETVHVEDYFKPITAGKDEQGNQLYTRWYKSRDVTHWMELPAPPAEEDSP